MKSHVKREMQYSYQSGANDYMKSIGQRHKHSLLAAAGGCYLSFLLYTKFDSAVLPTWVLIVKRIYIYWSVKMF